MVICSHITYSSKNCTCAWTFNKIKVNTAVTGQGSLARLPRYIPYSGSLAESSTAELDTPPL